MASRIVETDPLAVAQRAHSQANAAVSQLDLLKTGKLAEIEATLAKMAGDVEATGRTVTALNSGYRSLSERLTLQFQAIQGQDDEGEEEDEGERDWLTVAEPVEAFRWLCELDEWHTKVFRRMAGKDLPDCWPWHSQAVEVLLALMAQRAASYKSPTGVSDFRGRWLPNALAELTKAMGDCEGKEHRINRRTFAVDRTKLRELAEWHVTRQEGNPPGLTPVD